MDHVASGKQKKKKKENFLRQTKRLGKKGNYGKGKSLSEEEYNYYMRVMEQLRHVEKEDKEILVRNFIYEVESERQQRSLASNQIVSRILDEALPIADVSQVLTLMRVFGEDVRPLCVDPYASHVIQTLLSLALKYCQEGAVQKRFQEDEEGNEKEVEVALTEEQRDEFCSFLNKIGRFVYNNLEDFVCHTYASHIVRSVLQVSSGVEVHRSIKGSQRAQTSHCLPTEEGQLLTVPQVLSQLLHDLALRVTRLPNLPDILSSECGSAVVQTVLVVLERGGGGDELCEAVTTHLLTHGLPGVAAWYADSPDRQPDLPLLFHDGPTTRLLEILVKCCTSEQQTQVFEDYFKGSIKVLVQHRMANFAVQRLLSSWKEKETFEEVYSEVSEVVGAALEGRHMGVVHALVQACHRLTTCQSACLRCLMELMQCWEQEKLQLKLVPLLLRMTPYKEYQRLAGEGSLPPVSLQGSLIVQELLQFNKPIKVVNSVLEMSVGEVQMLASDPRGSHVLDAFTTSPFVGAKSREKLLHSLKGTFLSLACSKHGSRSLEALWKVAGTKAKATICTELASEEHRTKDNQYGTIIYNKFQVGLFKRGDRSDWETAVEKAEKKRKMFDDLLKDDSTTDEPVKKKKKKDKKKSKTEDLDITDSSIYLDTAGNSLG